jgi:hypothetical protein
MTRPLEEADSGSLTIPGSDGYHYADDHHWSQEDQAKLTKDLWATVKRFKKSGRAAPLLDTGSGAQA